MTIRALAIETSGSIGSVALAQDGKTLLEDTFPHGLQHAARIIPSIDGLCKKLNWTSNDLNEIYVSAGPGSFTGLRIGITLAKTLAMVTGAPLVAVPSVRVITENAPPEAKNVLIVLDAKRDQIFTAAFTRADGSWTELHPAQLSSITEMLAKSPRPLHLIGEGIPYHQKFIPQGNPEIQIVDQSRWRPQASTVATLGWQLAQQGNFMDPQALLPIYIRRPEAEEKLDGP
ncbi:MAG TPA: tRNA (adenosine(37)-N6)-threonylcarbamoyltransferase complex dimerization subunit type 1 TsaB [Tepidisphaeraceae bacterium]|jgi:tRNA threonylcarbamoyladenosine biosynthesis protein TsaB